MARVCCRNSSASALLSAPLRRRGVWPSRPPLDGADHVEGGLRQMVVLALAQALEAADGVGKLDEHAGRAGEHFGDMERLRQEALDLAGARDRQLVLFRQLVHAQDGDDVLQRLVTL